MAATDGRIGAASRLGVAQDVASRDGTTTNGDVKPAADPSLPDDVETLKAMLLAEREAYRAELREQALRIEQLKQRIARLQHDRFGQSSERRALLEQLELQLFELEEDQAQAETRLKIDAPPKA